MLDRKVEEMTKQGQNLVGQIQEQVQQTAQDFYGESLGTIKNQLATHRSQLQEIIEMLPESQEGGRAQLEQLLSSYEELESNLDEVAQEQGLQETVNQAAQQAQEAAGQATEQAQEAAGQVTEQAQEVAGQATDQAQGTAGQATEQLQGAAGEAVGQAQEATGETTEQAQGLAEQAPDLVTLSDSDIQLDEPWQDVQEFDIYDNNDDQIGSVDDLYVDPETLHPRFLDVSAGGFLGIGKKHFLIPVEEVSLDAGEERAVVNRERDTVLGSPEFDADEAPGLDLQRAVYAYYDLPYPEGSQLEEAVEEATEAAESAASGTQVLSETTNEAGQTVQRTVDESGSIVETTLDESGNLVDEDIVGNVTELSSEEEYTNEEGNTVRTVREEGGKLLHLSLGPEGSLLELSLPDMGDTIEEVTEESSEQYEYESQSETIEEGEPGSQLLSETANEAGQTVRRTVDESGNIIESTLDESGELVDEDIVGTVNDLPSEEEYTNEQGQTVRTVKEESGALLSLSIGPDGNILDVSLPPKKEEVVEEEVLEEWDSESHSETS